MIPQMKLERIPAKVNDKIILLDPMEIHFIETQNGVTHIHVREGDFVCALTLSELEMRLTGFGFLDVIAHTSLIYKEYEKSLRGLVTVSV